MRKLAVKILCAFLFVLSAAALAACGENVDLKEGAIVSLTVQTEAEEFDVTSTYGKVEGSGKAYTVSVDVKKDFAISVSAKGLKTQTVPVTVADLASGSCEKSVELKDEIEKEVSVTVSGDVENISVTCDGVDLVFKKGVYTGMLTRTQLKKGITVSADNAVTNTVTFTNEELESVYIKTEAYLVQTGYKVVELHGENVEDRFLVDSENRLVPITLIRDQSSNYYNATIGCRVILEDDYEGTLYLKKAYGYPSGDVAIEIEKDLPVYGTVIEFTDSRDSYHTVRLENYTPAADIQSNQYLYLEVEENNVRRLNRYTVRSSEDYYSGTYYYMNLPLNVEVFALWEISENGAKYGAYHGEETFDYSSMQATAALEPYICVYDYRFNEVRTDVNAVYYPIEPDYVTIWEYTYESVPLNEGIALFDTAIYGNEVCIQKDYGGGSYGYSHYTLYEEDVDMYIYANGKWCIPIDNSHDASYEIRLFDKEGNPVTGALFGNWYDSFEEMWFQSKFTETSPGVYESDNYYAGSSLFVKYNDKIEFFPSDVDWERDGYTYKADVTLTDPQTFGFYLEVTNIQSFWSNDLKYSFEAISEGVEISKLDHMSGNRSACYVRAPYDGEIQIKFTVTVRNRSTPPQIYTYNKIITIQTHDVWGMNYESVNYEELLNYYEE